MCVCMCVGLSLDRTDRYRHSEPGEMRYSPNIVLQRKLTQQILKLYGEIKLLQLLSLSFSFAGFSC